MKTKTLKAWIAISQLMAVWQFPAVVATVMLLLVGRNANAQVTVLALGGGSPTAPYYGYNDGTTLYAKFHTPSGLALDSSGTELLVADRDNSRIRVVDLVGGQTGDLIVTYTNLINKPIAVAADAYDDVYVLNTNGSIYTFDCNIYSPSYGEVITNALNLNHATGMALDIADNIYVTVQSNKLIRIAAFSNVQTIIATIPNTGTSLQGITVKHNGLVAACDAGRNGIYIINPATGLVTTNAGFHGVGDFITNSYTPNILS
jgi:DNA-binding beta-propeller fold protein YncE